jgi:hypothetical protein
VRRLTRRSASTLIYIAHVTLVEVTSAVARRRKGRTLTVAKASSILHRFRSQVRLARRSPSRIKRQRRCFRFVAQNAGSRSRRWCVPANAIKSLAAAKALADAQDLVE